MCPMDEVELAAKFRRIFYHVWFPSKEWRRQTWHRPRYWQNRSKLRKHPETTTDWRFSKPASGWIRWIMYSPKAGRSVLDACYSSSHFIPAAPREPTFPSLHRLLIKTRFQSASRRRFPEVTQ